MAAIFGKRKIFWKLPRVHFLDTLWVENFNEITLFCTVKANLCFSILGKNSKIQNGGICGEGKIFWKLPRVPFLDTPSVENFDEIALSRFRRCEHICLFSIQNSQLLIYLINYSLIYEAIPPKSNPIQAINPMNLHTKFQKARLNSIP